MIIFLFNNLISYISKYEIIVSNTKNEDGLSANNIIKSIFYDIIVIKVPYLFY